MSRLNFDVNFKHSSREIKHVTRRVFHLAEFANLYSRHDFVRVMEGGYFHLFGFRTAGIQCDRHSFQNNGPRTWSAQYTSEHGESYSDHDRNGENRLERPE